MKITSLQHACKVLKCTLKSRMPDVSKMAKHLQKHTLATAELELIAEASRNGVVLDYDDYSQGKYYNVFLLNKPGFRFGVVFCAVSISSAVGCPRLCFTSDEDARWHAKKYLAKYKAGIVIPKPPEKKK